MCIMVSDVIKTRNKQKYTDLLVYHYLLCVNYIHIISCKAKSYCCHLKRSACFFIFPVRPRPSFLLIY